MLVTEFGIVTEVRPIQPLNALASMLVTALGIVTDARLVQPLNALAPMLVTEFGIVTDVRLVQPLNALAPMLLTEPGIVTDISLLQFWNAELTTPVEPSPITALVIDEYAFGKTTDILNRPGTTTSLMPLQLENALFPILATESGIVTDVSPLQ